MLTISRTWPRAVTYVPQLISPSKRRLWHYLNIIFNRKDENRWKRFGPDRTCTEWILRNGGAVKLTCCQEYLHDYNLIPPEGATVTLTAVDATGSSIMHYGFDHFDGCKHLDDITLSKCDYIYDEALKELAPLSKQLKVLKVMECHNISDAGCMHLTQMKGLKSLTLSHLSAVKDIKTVGEALRKALPNCAITTV